MRIHAWIPHAGASGTTLWSPIPTRRPIAVDFTPLLPQMRKNQARAGRLIGDAGVVLCLGSRTLISFAVAAAREPARILGAATTEAEGLALVERERPELLFASDRLEAGCGASLVVEVKRRHPWIRILLLVTRPYRHSRLREAIEACCEAVIPEACVGLGAELTAIRSAVSGGIYIDREIGSACRIPAASGARCGLQPLSAREVQVLELLVEGASNTQIAERLIVSTDTVKTHIRHLLGKLQARDRTHAAVIAVRHGLVD